MQAGLKRTCGLVLLCIAATCAYAAQAAKDQSAQPSPSNTGQKEVVSGGTAVEQGELTQGQKQRTVNFLLQYRAF